MEPNRFEHTEPTEIPFEATGESPHHDTRHLAIACDVTMMPKLRGTNRCPVHDVEQRADRMSFRQPSDSYGPLVGLLEQHRAGELCAFAGLDKACRQPLHAWLQCRFRHPSIRPDCEDVVQEVLLRLAKGSESFPTDRELVAWLKQAAKNRLLNVVRRPGPKADSAFISTH